MSKGELDECVRYGDLRACKYQVFLHQSETCLEALIDSHEIARRCDNRLTVLDPSQNHAVKMGHNHFIAYFPTTSVGHLICRGSAVQPWTLEGLQEIRLQQGCELTSGKLRLVASGSFEPLQPISSDLIDKETFRKWTQWVNQTQAVDRTDIEEIRQELNKKNLIPTMDQVNVIGDAKLEVKLWKYANIVSLVLTGLFVAVHLCKMFKGARRLHYRRQQIPRSLNRQGAMTNTPGILSIDFKSDFE